jgi:hypothetical protein
MNIKEIGRDGVEIYVVQDNNQWRGLVRTVMNIKVL